MNKEQPSATPLGIWGMRHEAFLRQYRHSTYITLLTSGRLDAYLTEIDKQASKMSEALTKKLVADRGITETLKAHDPFCWVQQMNSVRAMVREIVYAELIIVG